MKNSLLSLLLVLLWLSFGVSCTSGSLSGAADGESAAIEPNPVVPAPRQLAYQQQEMIAFAHFTVNTFTDMEWGDGTESPQIFNPSALDARQWARTCREAGLKTLILTAKHHDGFCLWPSQYTEHSVKNSPWRNGQGDLVKEVSDACRAEGIKFGVYLSPWDRHEPSYGTDAYNDFYKNQLRELLTNYGEISEVWLDGAKGENAKDMEYDFEGYWALVRDLQPKAVLFSDAGPDVRWVGNEHGFAGETNWSMMDRSRVKIGTSETQYLNTGDPHGPDWVTAECDVSIRPGWFYHPKEDDKVKSLDQLLDIYYKSVGRNGVLLLNIPPDRRGLFHENDVQRLREFRAVLDETFQTNLATGKAATASSTHNRSHSPGKLTDGDPTTFWAAAMTDTTASVEIDLGGPQTFDRALLAEPIELGQRVAKFTFEAWIDNGWKPVAEGTTIGYKRLLRFAPIRTNKVRLTILEANNSPLISEIGLFKASPKEVIL
jgi:alpha-L-fucosidase